MIEYPYDWQNIGRPKTLGEIEDLLHVILSDIPCNSLALSGGLDSSLLLYFMLQIKENVTAFTIASSKNHPDYMYAKELTQKYMRVKHFKFIPRKGKIEREKQAGDRPGDAAVRLFYKEVAKYTDSIIAGDGIDEFMAGYYSHQTDQSELNYYDHIRELKSEHLDPLDRNSGNVKVWLPYLDERLLALLAQIPLDEKVDSNHRKKLMVEMAKGRIPMQIITRRKYGFCDVFEIKGEKNV